MGKLQRFGLMLCLLLILAGILTIIDMGWTRWIVYIIFDIGAFLFVCIEPENKHER